MKLLSNEEMRRADEAAMRALPPLTLMERAGRAIAEEAREYGSDFLVVCGSGNNGGDGYVAARYLKEWGFDVSVLAVFSPKSEDCRAMAALWQDGVLGRFPRRRYGVVIDCLFGTGLSRPLQGDAAEAVSFINRMGAFVLSADIPSGINGDNGMTMGTAVKADKTVAIAYAKRGCLMADGLDCCGKLVVKDIGIPSDEGIEVLEDISPYFPPRKRNVHKGTFGRACLIAGSMAYSGAGLLALSALLKTGVGYAELNTGRDVLPHYIGKFPEAILSVMGEDREHLLGAKSVGIGCGLTVSPKVYEELCFLFERYEGTLVIDADGLNSLAKFGVQALKHKACKVVLTPHPKEFSRLSGKSLAEIVADPVGEARAFAKKYGVTVLLKGASSVITDGEKSYLNVAGSPALAKGGSGDVLTGLITGLCARLSPLEGAAVGAYLLGRAGERAEKKRGAYCATATDVLEEIPSCLHSAAEQAEGKR